VLEVRRRDGTGWILIFCGKGELFFFGMECTDGGVAIVQLLRGIIRGTQNYVIISCVAVNERPRFKVGFDRTMDIKGDLKFFPSHWLARYPMDSKSVDDHIGRCREGIVGTLIVMRKAQQLMDLSIIGRKECPFSTSYKLSLFDWLDAHISPNRSMSVFFENLCTKTWVI